MNLIRERVKEHFPTVLLTLLSIVQALALELLWAHIHEVDYLYESSWVAMLSWVQISATLIGLILVWVIYASNVMRFRWVPTTGDSVIPFAIGLLEFLLVETLGLENLGMWLLYLAMVFIVMNIVAHITFRKARLDGDNAAYFDAVKPAKIRDFYADILSISGLALASVYFLMSGNVTWPALTILVLTNIMLAWQFYKTSQFWELSIAAD